MKEWETVNDARVREHPEPWSDAMWKDAEIPPIIFDPDRRRCIAEPVLIERRAFSFWNDNGVGFVRLFGYGIHWKDSRRSRLSFSERNGHVRLLRIGHWSFKFLLPMLVLCATIADPSERADCRARQSRGVGQCSFITDPAQRRTCQARVSGRPSPCNTVTGAWEREKCRREARP